MEPELAFPCVGCVVPVVAWLSIGYLGRHPFSCTHPQGPSGQSLIPLFPSRESKELADLARLHPTSCAANGLNPNLMVTGGPALAGSGRWSADPAAHLATHPWLPRSGNTSMWLAGHPYGECEPGHLSLAFGTELHVGPTLSWLLSSLGQACAMLPLLPTLHLICPGRVITTVLAFWGSFAKTLWGQKLGVGGCGRACSQPALGSWG